MIIQVDIKIAKLGNFTPNKTPPIGAGMPETDKHRKNHVISYAAAIASSTASQVALKVSRVEVCRAL